MAAITLHFLEQELQATSAP